MISELHIGIPMFGQKNWIGGVTYVELLVQAITTLPKEERPQLFLIVQNLDAVDLHRAILSLFDGIIYIGHDLRHAEAVLQRHVLHIRSDKELSGQIDFYYPVVGDVLPGICSASWIFDFQHVHLPEFFSSQEITARNNAFQKIAMHAKMVVFSSKDAENDFKKLYPHSSSITRILSFHKLIPEEWYFLEPDKVQKKYGLPDRFFLCSNQFFAHKNHLRLLEAIALLYKAEYDVHLVCTGSTNDYRFPGYFKTIQQKIIDLDIQSCVHILGIIPRIEQLQLMRRSLAVIQPSLFEGWSTVVEDARALGKTIFLSDLPVHFEQAPHYAEYFNRYEAEDLAKSIKRLIPNLQPGPDRGREQHARLEGIDLVKGYASNFCAIATEAQLLFGHKQNTAIEEHHLQSISAKETINPSTENTGNIPLLSIVLQGRNDSYMGNFEWRLSTNINKFASNIFALNAVKNVEIILVDWGSEVPLLSALTLTEQSRSLLKIIRVEPHISKKYDRDSPYSCVHPINTGIRKSRGKYILFCDGDTYTPFETMKTLLDLISRGTVKDSSLKKVFLLGSRYHIPKLFNKANPSIQEIDQYIENNFHKLTHDKINLKNFGGTATAYLMTREMWFECRGFDEKLIYWGWFDIDLFYRLAPHYHPLDLEDFGMPFFHLEHYFFPRSNSSLEKENPRKMNPMDRPRTFFANSKQWGLAGEPLQAIPVLSSLSESKIPPSAFHTQSKTMATEKTIKCPLTHNSNISIERQISTRDIIRLYRQWFQVDVAKYFKQLEYIQIYKCLDTDYRFYYPFSLEGKSDFYECLQKFPWYYMDWKWEYQIAKQLIQPGNQVLEIGCGKGSFVAKLTQEKIDCTGLELNEYSARMAKDNGLKILNETLMKHLDNNFERYDIVCSFQVMEHIASVREFINDSIKALKTGGKLIISVPNHDAFIGLDQLNILDMPPHHVGLWNEKSLMSIAGIFNIQLENIYIEPLQSYHIDYYIGIMKRAINNDLGLHPVIEELVRTSPEKFKGHTILVVYVKQ
ncbi:MAG: methyltransferase domain-containing protein [Nitrospirota bacterium]